MTDKYGPNTPAVEALLARVLTLTPDEADRLGAARDAAGDAARGAAWDAARVAAWALVVRDLISPEHFAALTGPWVSVVGATWDGEAAERAHTACWCGHGEADR